MNFQYSHMDLADAVVHSRAIQAFDSAVASYPIHRLARCAARRPLESVFDDLALKSGLTAQRLYAGSLLLDGEGVFVQAEGRRKAGYCTCALNIWASSIERAEQVRDNVFCIVGDDCVRDQMFAVDWRVADRRGNTQANAFEELADEVMVDEAYPMLGEPVQQFIERYLAAPEFLMVADGVVRSKGRKLLFTTNLPTRGRSTRRCCVRGAALRL